MSPTEPVGTETETDADLEVGGTKPSSVENQPASSSVKASDAPTDGKEEHESLLNVDGMDAKKGRILPYYRLATETSVRDMSINVLRFAIFSNGMNIKVLQPNYPLMVSPGATDQSFDNTNPFDFNSATYFIPLTAALGIAITSVFAGHWSDKIGRKSIILFSTVTAGIGSIVKWAVQDTFWGFCAANLATGLVSGCLPVGMAYVADVSTSKVEKDTELSKIVGYHMLGSSGGGIVAILMESTGLFNPLWVTAGFMFIAGWLVFKHLIEPGDARLLDMEPELVPTEEEDEEEETGPEEIDKTALWNIILGSLADNIGSNALFPLCLSPLAIEQYLLGPEDPLMTITGYKWLSVMVALMVVPATLSTPWIFAKVGAAAACVMGNLFTAVITIALLYIGNGPQTTAAFAGFVVVLYAGFPLTVISQLTTGPMLEAISPPEKRGYSQGLNSTVMNFAIAFAPWLLGLLADGAGTNTAIWTGIGVSLLAAAINTPLMFRKGLGRPPKKVPPELRPLKFEDKEVVEKALRGEWVAPETLAAVNRERELRGQPIIVVRPRTYEEDQETMIDVLNKNLEGTFRYRHERTDRWLALLSDPDRQDQIPELCDRVNKALDVDPVLVDEVYDDLGKWFAEYLKDNGYYAYTSPLLIKQMILSAFPTVMKDKKLTPENVEQMFLNTRRVYSQYLQVKDDRKYTYKNILGDGGTHNLYG